ncbi:MAG: dTMP kinase [Desulfurococcales archaeon ex4484_42]|nr:MAG: dTMP kinase [Desulfurococcales archaeon ex4484_42]
MRGKLIVVEGIDGAGKTTIAKYLVNTLISKGFKAIYTREPYHPQIIKLLESKGKELGAIMEALLLAADRYLHIQEVIKPHLEVGYYVICDRYYYSSLAYQTARGADINWIRTINFFIIRPDVSIYLDVNPEVGLSRLSKNSERRLRYLENIELLQKVRNNYLNLVRNEELMYVNAEKPLSEVKTDVVNIIKRKLRIEL